MSYNRLIDHHKTALRCKENRPQNIVVSHNVISEHSKKLKNQSLSDELDSDFLWDIVFGFGYTAALLCLGALFFHLKAFGVAFSIFACAYFVFFYNLCTAGVRQQKNDSYVSGIAWQNRQRRNRRKSGKSGKSVKSGETRSHIPSIILTNIDDDTYFDISHNTIGNGDNSIRDYKSHDAPEFDIAPVNPATGLTMIGAVDVAGNPYGTDLNSTISDINSINTFDDNISSLQEDFASSTFDDDLSISDDNSW